MSSDRPRVPAPTGVPGLLTTPLAQLYRLGIGYRNRRFDAGRGVTALDCPVISVGNLSTGGTGKSPMVHLVVGLLREQGHTPIIAMRGYGAKPGQKGDEQLEHEEALPGVPIVAQPDRIAGLRALLERDEGIDCVVLDDGFQHRQIARDLDIVLIDASRPPDRDALLPRGHLREPPGSLARAGLVVLTHAERVDADALGRTRAFVEHHSAGAMVLTARHVWSGAVKHTRTDTGWASAGMDLEELNGLRVNAICGIGNPDAFFAMASDAGLQIGQHQRMADHAEFTESQVGAWALAQEQPNAPVLLMTRKDWVKVSTLRSWRPGCRVIVPDLEVQFDDLNLLRDRLASAFAGR